MYIIDKIGTFLKCQIVDERLKIVDNHNIHVDHFTMMANVGGKNTEIIMFSNCIGHFLVR
jgi:hypothetical protein